jgi:hypothetical protein
MNFNAIILLVTIFFMAVSIVLGRSIVVKKDNGEKYSFLRNFPFELKVNDNNGLNLLFKCVLGLSVGLMMFSSYLTFFVDTDIFTSKFLAVFLVFDSLAYLTIFLFDTTSYKIHVGIASTLFVFNIAIYFILGYLSIRDNFQIVPMWVCIASFVVLGCLIIVNLLPSLANWYYLKKEKSNKGEIYSRGKVFILALVEWINVFAVIIFYIILFIYKIA